VSTLHQISQLPSFCNFFPAFPPPPPPGWPPTLPDLGHSWTVGRRMAGVDETSKDTAGGNRHTALLILTEPVQDGGPIMVSLSARRPAALVRASVMFP
jgi:hypothetical protein